MNQERNIYIKSEIANEYFKALQKRKELCLFDEAYLQKNILENYKVLDLGCGTGRHLAQLGNKTDITGVDISPKMIETANEILKIGGIKAKTQVGDILDIDKLFGKETFDAAIMMYHTFGCIVPRKKRIILLKKIRDVIKKNGSLILHVHNRNHIKNLKFLFYTHFISKLELGDKLITDGELTGVIIHFFSRKELEKDLKSAGFKIIEFLNLKFPHEDREIYGFKKYFLTGGFIINAKKI